MVHTTEHSSQRPFSNLLVVGWEFTDAHRRRLSPYFSTINHVPQGVPSNALLAQADVIYGLPNSKWLTSRNQVPKLRLIQLGSSGSDYIVNSAMWKEEDRDKIQLTNASGVAVGPIPQVKCAPARQYDRAANNLFTIVLHCDHSGLVPPAARASTHKPGKFHT